MDKKVHSFLRKRLSGAYSMSSVLRYETHIQNCLDLLLQKLRNHAQAGKDVDMAVWTNAFAFDVVGELGYGTQLGHLREEKDVNNLRKTIFDIFKIMSSMGHFPRTPFLIWIRISQFISSIVGSVQPMDVFLTWSTSQVRKRINNQEESKRHDLLGHFCQMKDQHGNPARFEEVLIEAINLV